MKTIIAVLFLCSVALIALVIHLDNRNLALVKENFALQAKLLGSSAGGCGSSVSFEYSPDGIHWTTVICGPIVPEATQYRLKAGAHSETLRRSDSENPEKKLP